MTDTLSDFLLALIAEAEVKANDAALGHPAPWKLRDHESDPWMIVDAKGEFVVHDDGAPSDEAAAHIAYWDPARVLADCAAKRHAIQACTYWLGEDNADTRSLAVAVLTSLASAHTAHPGFNPVWLETV